MMKLQLLLKGHSPHRFVQFHQESVVFGMTEVTDQSRWYLLKALGYFGYGKHISHLTSKEDNLSV